MPNQTKYGADDYASGFANLLPRGAAWPRDADSNLMKLVSALAEIWGVEVDDLMYKFFSNEADPRYTLDMLYDWERAFGLPDECAPEDQSIESRRNALITRMTMIGTQSRQFFINIAAYLGYTIKIDEFSPFMCGVSECGDTFELNDANAPSRWEIGAEEIRFYWRVRILDARLIWFRCGEGQCGVDPHLRIDVGDDLMCFLNRMKPAHTDIVYAYYSGPNLTDEMSGTP